MTPLHIFSCGRTTSDKELHGHIHILCRPPIIGFPLYQSLHFFYPDSVLQLFTLGIVITNFSDYCVRKELWVDWVLTTLITSSRMSTSVNLLGTFNLLRSCSPSKIVSTSLYPPVCWCANNLRAHTKCSHAAGEGACARNTFASLRTALSCVTKTLFGSNQLYWPPHAAHHQLHIFSP